MPVPTALSDLSTTASSNSPAGSDSIGAATGVDDYLRAHARLIALLRDAASATAIVSTITGADGAGSGLDADLLDGQHGSYYLAAGNLSGLATAIAAVDGAGSGIDADLLGGQSSAYYLAAASYTAADVLSKLLTVDGAGSGLDADLLDGQTGTYYTNASNLASGTVATARLGSGTANSTTFLRGDGTWAAPSVSINSVQAGTITIGSGSTSNTATITSVDTTKSFVVFNGASTSSTALNRVTARVALTNATTVTATRESSVDEVTVAFTVVEFA